MQIYLGGSCLYGFDRQKAFGARYLAENPSASREHWKHDKNNLERKGNVATKK